MKELEYRSLARQIISLAKERAKADLFTEQQKIDIKLRLSPGKEGKLINELRSTLKDKLNTYDHYNVKSEPKLLSKLIHELRTENHLTDEQIKSVRLAKAEILIKSLTEIYINLGLKKFLNDILPPLVENNQNKDYILVKEEGHSKRLTSDSHKSKARLWHRVFLYILINKVDGDINTKKEIKTIISQQYGWSNGNSFYTIYQEIINFKANLSEYIALHHSNPKTLKTYKLIIRSLPQYHEKVERLLNSLPE